jgi:hypothetical protein
MYAVAALAGVVAAGREHWIGVLFGAQYLPCTLAVACRLPGIAAESLSLVLVGDFLGRARVHGVLAVTGVAVGLGVLLNAWLVPVGGIAAAACAFSLASWVRAGGLVWHHTRCTGLPIRAYLAPTRADVLLIRTQIGRLRGRRSGSLEVAP